MPLNAATSPNDVLICTSTASGWPFRTSIHSLPRAKKESTTPSKCSLDPHIIYLIWTGTARPPLSIALAAAVLVRRSAIDVVHVLSAPSIPLAEVIDVLYHAFAVLDASHNGLSLILTWEMLGVVVDVYR